MGATYKLDKDTNLFGRIATGYRGSSIQNPDGFAALTQAKPETLTSYEAGIKADLFNKRARTSFSVFHYDVKDQQLTAVGGANNSNQLVSAAKASGDGVELNFDAYVTPNFLVTLSGSYNETKISDSSPGCGRLRPVHSLESQERCWQGPYRRQLLAQRAQVDCQHYRPIRHPYG